MATRGVEVLSDLGQCNKPIVHVAMLGARGNYAVPRILEKAGLLGTLYTDVYFGNKPWLHKLLGQLRRGLKHSSLERVQGRVCEGLPPRRVVSFDALGLQSFWLRRRAGSKAQLNSIYARTNQAFCERVIRNGLGRADAVYGFNGASLEIFREARRRGMFCLLEQTSASRPIEKQLVAKEVQRWPGWEPGHTLDSHTDPLADREGAEWALADRIICGSAFVVEGLQSVGVEAAKCQVTPYGVDTRHFRPRETSLPGGVLNVLFVGRVSLQKGIPYLLEALRELNSSHIRCRLVGTVTLDRRRLTEYSRWVEVVGPVPRTQVLEAYHWADVFVFPSICEGSALVTYEAMACGLPVITTSNAGSVIRDGEEGFITPIRNPEALAERLERLLSDRDLFSVMSQKALKRILDFTWDRYGERLVQVIQSLCQH